MLPFANMMAAGGVGAAIFVASSTAIGITGAVTTLTAPSTLFVGDMLVVIRTEGGGNPTIGGTAVSSWTNLSYLGGGDGMQVAWGLVTNPAGTISYPSHFSSAETILLTQWRGCTTLTAKTSVQPFTPPLTVPGFVKASLSRGVLCATAEYNVSGDTNPYTFDAGLTGEATYKQTVSGPHPGGGGAGAGFATATQYADNASVTVSHSYFDGTTSNAALLEFT